MQQQQVPIAEDLITWSAAEPRLLGSRCASCGAYTFPAQDSCPRCSDMDMERVELSRVGTVWTWTSQEFLPPSPPYAGPETTDTFERYYVGYVELDGELRVETRLVGFTDQPPRIGQPVEMVLIPFRTDEEGNQVMTFAFAPTRGL
jgi:uncharacterized protein